MTNRWKQVTGAMLLSLLLAACSNDDGGGGGGGAGETGQGETPAVAAVAPDAYAKSLCTSVQTYVSDVRELSNTFVSGLDPAADLEGQRDAVVSFLDDVLAATDTLLSELQAAGVPDVDGGDQIVDAVSASFEEARQVIDEAKAQVEGLSLDDPQAFATELSEIGTTIQTSLGSVGGSLSGLDSPELTEAVAAEPACSDVAAAGGGG